MTIETTTVPEIANATPKQLLLIAPEGLVQIAKEAGLNDLEEINRGSVLKLQRQLDQGYKVYETAACPKSRKFYESQNQTFQSELPKDVIRYNEACLDMVRFVGTFISEVTDELKTRIGQEGETVTQILIRYATLSNDPLQRVATLKNILEKAATMVGKGSKEERKARAQRNSKLTNFLLLQEIHTLASAGAIRGDKVETLRSLAHILYSESNRAGNLERRRKSLINWVHDGRGGVDTFVDFMSPKRNQTNGQSLSIAYNPNMINSMLG